MEKGILEESFLYKYMKEILQTDNAEFWKKRGRKEARKRDY
jgi:hypothetical protein